MPKKLGSVLLTLVLILVVGYIVLAIVQTVIDQIQAKDWIGMYSLAIIILFGGARQFPAFKKDKAGKWLVWLFLLGALFVGQLIKYILLNILTGILFYAVAIVGVIMIYFLKIRSIKSIK